MKRKRRIITSDKEFYEKMLMLNISSEVVLKGIEPLKVKRMIKNINKNNKILDMEKIGKYIVVKKKNPINFNIYFINNKKKL